MDILLPLFAILLSVVGVTIYILIIALRDALRQITRMNEQLLLMAGMKDGNIATGRALLASAKRPVKPMPGLAKGAKSEEKPKDKKPKYQYTMGSR